MQRSRDRPTRSGRRLQVDMRFVVSLLGIVLCAVDGVSLPLGIFLDLVVLEHLNQSKGSSLRILDLTGIGLGDRGGTQAGGDELLSPDESSMRI